MGNGLLPKKHGNHGIGPQRNKRPDNRFQPYGAGHVPAERPLGVSNLWMETPQLPRQSESNSGTPSDPYEFGKNHGSDPVETYDLALNHKAAATAKASDYAKWDIAPAEFIRSDSGLGNGWVGKRPLGAGGFGMAGLWEKLDGNGAVVEVKSTFSTSPMNCLTASKQMVIKQMGVRKGIWRSEMPMEVKMMKKMEATKCPSVVRYIAYRRFLHDQVHRIYMEFCPHGDLKRLYRRYRKFRFVHRLVRTGFEVLNLSRLYMPEPFLWDVFHNLVEAAVAMRYGPTDGGWAGHEIVHRDIKPGNSPTPDFFTTTANAN